MDYIIETFKSLLFTFGVGFLVLILIDIFADKSNDAIQDKPLESKFIQYKDEFTR